MSKKQATFIEMLEEKLGEDIIEKDEDFSQIRNIDIIPTGSVSLDCSIGIGGIPRGRITTIFGPESSGKTTLALSISSQAVKKGLRVLYVDQENGLDHNYIRAIVGNIDQDSFLLTQPETAEQTLFICEQGIKSGEFQLIILDSIGALAPEKEKEDEQFKQHVAQVPRLLSAFLRRNAYAIRTNNIAFLFINQIRANIGIMYGPNTDMPGGYAIKHYSSIIIHLGKGTQIKQVKSASEEEVIGALSHFTVRKNKLASPFKGYQFPLIYGKGIDYTRDLLDFASMLSIIEKRGSYFSFEGETLAQGVDKSVTYLNNNPNILDKIVNKVYNYIVKKEEPIEQIT